MHYYKHYTGEIYQNESGQCLKVAVALQHTRDWMGEETWAKFGALFIQPDTVIRGYAEKKALIRNVRMCMMFAGVQYFPVTAYIRTVLALHAPSEVA